MILVELIPSVVAVLVLAVSGLGWYVKLRWSKEFSAAKEAQIAAKEAQVEGLESQIQLLQDITPTKMLEYLKSTQEGLGQQVEELKKDLTIAREEAKDKQYLAAKVESLVSEIKKLEGEQETITQASEIVTTVITDVGIIHFNNRGEQARAVRGRLRQGSIGYPDPFSDDPPTDPENPPSP